MSDAKYPFHDLASSNDTAKHTQLIFAKDDKLIGSFGNELSKASREATEFDGKAGNDTLYGDGGKDRLDGGEGWTPLTAAKARIRMCSRLTRVTGSDVITKFEKGEHIELSRSSSRASLWAN